MEVKPDDEMVQELLTATEELQQAVINFQTEVERWKDFGDRLRSMTERLKPSGGTLDDVGLMRLPRGIRPNKKPEVVQEEQAA